VLLELAGGRITSIGQARPGEARDLPSVDLLHCTLLPGLLDSHVHACLSGTRDPSLRRRQIRASFEEAKETIRRNLDRQWLHGVMAVRDGGDREGYALQYSRRSAASEGNAVRLLAAGSAWHAEGRYGNIIGRTPQKGLGLAGAIEDRGRTADHLKILNSGINSLTEFGRETPPQFTLEELSDAVAVAHELGLKVMMHANGREPVRLAVEAGVDSVEHGYFMGAENLRAMAEKTITWVPTVLAMKALSLSFEAGSVESDTAKRTLDHQIEQIRLARELGVIIALGTDAGSVGVHHGWAILEEMRLFREAGLSWEEVVRCATSTGARLVGLEQELGSLTAGMPATFVAVKGGPECLPDSLASPEAVWVRGEPCRPGS
jgi:imidazolonepropionase-like amidohydrolase